MIEIGGEAFTHTNIRSVVIPDSVVTIGHRAFSRIPLESVVIPDSVINIESYAFDNNYYLQSLELGNSIENIGSYAFANHDLSVLTIPPSVSYIGEHALSKYSAIKRIAGMRGGHDVG